MSIMAPNTCPSCGAKEEWNYVGTQKKGYSVGKAALGAVFLGPVGLVGGALGKKVGQYYCRKCNFSAAYTILATKDGGGYPD